MIRVAISALAMCWTGALAAAHDANCANKPQPLEVKSGCCGTADYAALKTTEVRADGAGFDVFLDGSWWPARHFNTHEWLIAQPTAASCWGIWYKLGLRNGNTEYWYGPQEQPKLTPENKTQDYVFYCLEQPASF